MSTDPTMVEAPQALDIPVVVTTTAAKPRWYALVDVAERAGWTFVQAFAAAVTIGTLTDVAAVKLAGIAGAFAVLKFMGTKASEYLKN